MAAAAEVDLIVPSTSGQSKVNVQIQREEFLWTISGISALYPNVFQDESLTCDEKYALLEANEEEFSSLREKNFQIHRVHSKEPCEACDQNQPFVVGMVSFKSESATTDRGIILWVYFSFPDFHIHRNANNKESAKLAIQMEILDKSGKISFAPAHSIFIDISSTGKAIDPPDVINHFFDLPPLVDMWNQKDKYFEDDKLRIKILMETTTQEKPQQFSCLPNSLLSLSSDFTKLLESGDQSDFTIKCGLDEAVKEFRVHKLIMSVRSPVFAAMLTSGMQEILTDHVTIPDVSADTFQELLNYMYGSHINIGKLDFEKVCELVHTSDKYQLEELKTICFTHMVHTINKETAGRLAALAFRHSASDDTRAKIMKYCTKHILELKKSEEFKSAVKGMSVDFFDILLDMENMKTLS